MELRTLTARLLLKYDIAFAPGEDGTRILTETKGKRWRNIPTTWWTLSLNHIY